MSTLQKQDGIVHARSPFFEDTTSNNEAQQKGALGDLYATRRRLQQDVPCTNYISFKTANNFPLAHTSFFTLLSSITL